MSNHGTQRISDDQLKVCRGVSDGGCEIPIVDAALITRELHDRRAADASKAEEPDMTELLKGAVGLEFHRMVKGSVSAFNQIVQHAADEMIVGKGKSTDHHGRFRRDDCGDYVYVIIDTQSPESSRDLVATFCQSCPDLDVHVEELLEKLNRGESK